MQEVSLGLAPSLTAAKVESKLLELAAISVRYCLAQCLRCWGVGRTGECMGMFGCWITGFGGEWSPSVRKCGMVMVGYAQTLKEAEASAQSQ